MLTFIKGYEFHGYTQHTIESLDGYVRQRLRVNFSCRGKKHGRYTQGRLLNVKYPNKFFGIDMGLVCGEYMTKMIEIPNLKIDEFYEKGLYRKRKRTWKWGDKDELFQYMYAK